MKPAIGSDVEEISSGEMLSAGDDRKTEAEETLSFCYFEEVLMWMNQKQE